MPPTDRRRDLLIALASATIHRAALCRLGAELDRWADVRGGRAARDAARRIGLPYPQLRRALDLRRHASGIAGAQLARAERLDARIVCRGDRAYPQAFDAVHLPPPALWLRGEPGVIDAAPAIAIVGARGMDAYGRKSASRFARALAEAGIAIVSGFAVGVDQTAHRGALDAIGGHTIAVLGCGIDVDYPARSRTLAGRIAERGALLTELPPDSPPRPFHFPMRNRLIAALALGVLVVQAKTRSGSLITAHHALELGKDVWAVPGPIDRPLAGGPNGLIADGAALVERPEDILDTLPLATQQTLFPSRKEEPRPGTASRSGMAGGRSRPTGLAGTLYDNLAAGGPHTADDLAADAGSTVERVLGALLELELGGLIRRLPGPRYARV